MLSFARFVLCLVVVAGATTGLAPSASATITRLCTTYAGCTKAGMGSDGYDTAGNQMYWRMYSGHNCTNYVAYRMVRSGLPNERPWSGGGNASEWGRHLADRTDDTPAVGAVAWWKANVPGAGSSGHVAYVERVVSADEIIVSQDSWGGEFSWARVTRSGTGWPSGFIHLNDATMRNTVAPVVRGEARVGQVLTATAGTWRPGTVTTSYRWRADGRAIAGATGSTFTLSPAEQGKRVTVAVTARQLGYPSVTVSSAPTEAVLRGDLTAVEEPSVAGTPVADGTLTLNRATWDPAPDATAVQWYADGVAVPGATGPRLRVGAGLVGSALSVREVASRSGFAPVTVSADVGTVRPGTLSVRTNPVLSGHPRLRQPLGVDAGRTVQAATASVQWLRDGVPVPGATAPMYTPSLADLGARLGARVTWTRPGYQPATATSARTVSVKAAPRLTVRAQPRGGGRVVVNLAVTAPGSSPVDSAVRIRVAGRQVAQTRLHDGNATVTLTKVARGRRAVSVHVLGNARVLAASASRAVAVR